jgi:site-specific DNA recombinase
MSVGLYIRVSTQEQAKEGYSIGEQEERLKNYCKAMLWDIYKIYVDPGYSGGDTDRPGLQDMIKDVEDGNLEKVVVYKLDRLSRSQKDTLYLIEDVFLKNNTDFVSMTENFDTSTSFGRAMIGILAVFAQLEREKIKERMSMGKEARAKLGKWNGGTEPIGYDYSIADDMLYVNEYEQIQLKELRELFLSGTPLRTIETLFREKGYKHKHGVWDPKAMRRVLRSKIYLGYLNYLGEWYPGDHEVTLDDETHYKLVKLLDARAEQYKLTGIKPGAQTTFLGGLL